MGGGAALAIKYGGRIANSTSNVTNKRLFQSVSSSNVPPNPGNVQPKDKVNPTIPEYREPDSSFVNVSNDIAVHDLSNADLRTKGVKQY